MYSANSAFYCIIWFMGIIDNLRITFNGNHVKKVTDMAKYNLFTNNCATAVQEVMIKAGFPVSKPSDKPNTIPIQTSYGLVEIFNGYSLNCDINFIPNVAFQSIIKWNPEGKLIRKQTTDNNQI